MDRIKVGVTYVMRNESNTDIAESYAEVPVRADLAGFDPDGWLVAHPSIHKALQDYVNVLAKLQGYYQAGIEALEEVDD